MTVTAKSLKNLQIQIQASNHPIIADEPKHDGGDDAGPSPYDLLLSALAACKVMTVHLYARRKNWPVETVSITLSHNKTYARDCEECQSSPNTKIDIIQTELSFEGDLDADQIKRLADIADRCPVHRTLTSETIIRKTVITA